MRRLSEIPCQMLARIVDLHVRAVRYSGKKSHAVCSFFGVFLCGFRTPLTSPSFCNFLVRCSVYIAALNYTNLKLHQTLEAKSIFKRENIMLQWTFYPGLTLSGFRPFRPRLVEFFRLLIGQFKFQARQPYARIKLDMIVGVVSI